ncbi:MAG: hypothetical protein ACYDH1_01105 [Anaerolineaceae bacterium]
MSLIDFPSLISNFIWILALAWLLVVVSMARWEAHRLSIRLREQLDKSTQQVQLNVGGLLFCLGMGLVTDKTWQIVLWFILAFVFLIQIVLAARSSNS